MVPDDPVADIKQAIRAAEQRRDQQLAYIAILDGFGASKAHAQRVLHEIETTLQRSREHLVFVRDMFDGGEDGGHALD
uniref:hypothetical protein n=1 Tax=Methylobacterium sp. TaxID=409 RepID=UPI0020CA0AE1|nr:hypothetical protein [Methylobacterium sp.]